MPLPDTKFPSRGAACLLCSTTWGQCITALLLGLSWVPADSTPRTTQPEVEIGNGSKARFKALFWLTPNMREDSGGYGLHLFDWMQFPVRCALSSLFLSIAVNWRLPHFFCVCVHKCCVVLCCYSLPNDNEISKEAGAQTDYHWIFIFFSFAWNTLLPK